MTDLIPMVNRAEVWMLVAGTPLLLALVRNWFLILLPLEIVAAIITFVYHYRRRRYIAAVRDDHGNEVAPPTSTWGWLRYSFAIHRRQPLLFQEYRIGWINLEVRDWLAVMGLGTASIVAWSALSGIARLLPRPTALVLAACTWVAATCWYAYTEAEHRVD